MKSKLTNCKVCEKEIAKSAKRCPHCGAKVKKPFYKKVWFWIIVVIIIGAAGSGGESKVETDIPATTQVQNIEVNVEEAIEVLEEVAAELDVKEDDSVSKEFKSALKKAKTYSDMMFMSKEAIYDQLTSEYGEKFPEDAAQYAIDNLDVDYKYNALKKAETYSKTMYMSKEGIYDQLVSSYGEKFTEEEAQYAVDNLVADYKVNALEKAKTYQDMMDMSKSAIYDQLISSYGEKFTKEEAQYAVDNLE